ncbi:MAG: beta-ketoacyl synthase N-terminal-like domain-containing protein [Phycisphaeraceae bacterium]
MTKPSSNNTDQHADVHTPPARIVIAGFGLVTALGEGAWPTFRALLEGRTLADRAGALPADIEPVDLARALGCVASVQHGGVDPAVLLAERASREAATMAGVAPGGLGLWLGTSKGAVARLSRTLGEARPIDNDAARCVALGPHAYLADQLCRRLHTRAVSHHVAACSSGLVALDAARRALLRRYDDADAHRASYALVASADAAITPAFVHSYRRLGVLGDTTRDGYHAMPLDERRNGFMLGEVGAAVLLRRVAQGLPMPAGAIELVDTATACEPFDLVRSPTPMHGLAGLWRRVSAGRSFDLVHPHSPGTREHDPAELDVLLPPASPDGLCDAPADVADVYAVKGAIGHGLGASGLASLVVSALTLSAGRRPPMPWLTQPIQRPGGRRLETDADARACSRTGSQAVLAAGFGGHLAAAVLRGHAKRPRLP